MYKQNQFGQTTGLQVENWIPRELPSQKTMFGNYCVLEFLDINKHAAKLFTAFQFNNPGETWTYLPFGPFDTYDEFKEWLNKSSLSKQVFVINQNDSPQGIACFHDIDLEHGVIEIGSIHYSKLLQKTQAATEAMYLMMHRVFEEHGYRRYQWRCNALNQNSRYAAERLGFKFEGTFRQTNIFKGCNRDTAWYSIIDNEWPTLKMKFQKWLDLNNFDVHGNQLSKLQEI